VTVDAEVAFGVAVMRAAGLAEPLLAGFVAGVPPVHADTARMMIGLRSFVRGVIVSSSRRTRRQPEGWKSACPNGAATARNPSREFRMKVWPDSARHTCDSADVPRGSGVHCGDIRSRDARPTRRPRGVRFAREGCLPSPG
jgi:hypothetical protein